MESWVNAMYGDLQELPQFLKFPSSEFFKIYTCDRDTSNGLFIQCGHIDTPVNANIN